MNKKYKKIYMLTPPAYVTGGVEASFQIADAINKQGGTCITVFSGNVENPVPDEYKRYEIKLGDVEVSPENLFIVPEIWPTVLDSEALKNMDKAIWWLSVDHNRGSTTDFNKDILHLYQSYYAEDFLQKNRAKRKLPIFDYLSDEYFNNQETPIKENIICYSIKGETLANKLIQLLPQYKFVMLKNMTRLQVIETLKTSKIFIDFGYHPGKDRIPREAAILNNCVITNKKGAANYNKDVNILDSYKFENEDLIMISEKIKDCIENYENRLLDFEDYRKEIRNQKSEFFEQVKNLIN